MYGRQHQTPLPLTPLLPPPLNLINLLQLLLNLPLQIPTPLITQPLYNLTMPLHHQPTLHSFLLSPITLHMFQTRL